MMTQMSQGMTPEMKAKLPEGMQESFGAMQGIMKDLSSSIPGIDEAISFSELMRSVNNMTFSTIVFDTAPTGHTLRLLSFPKTLEAAFGKLSGLKSKFGGILSSVSKMFGGGKSL